MPASTEIEERDPMGRMALFSEIEPAPPARSPLVVECSSCLKATPVSPVSLARAALPFSVHLPLIRRYPSFMKCPACGRRTWVRVSFKP
jgi:hypothetical protein